MHQPTNQPSPELAQATDELRRALSATEGGKYWIGRLAFIVAAGVLVAGGFVWRARHRPPPPARFSSVTIATGDVIEKVLATGTLQPVLQVNIGAQANGRVTKVLVDYNSVVKRGDVLAEIDPTFYDAQVLQAQATVAAQVASAQSARANADMAKVAYDRLKSLFQQNLTSKSELDAAEGQYRIARAQAGAASAQTGASAAQLKQSRANVDFTRLLSPVDGIVVTRAIDPGATVVASYQSPVLFVLAKDLRRMRILADIDEADVGRVTEGMEADAVVDAFPHETFHGTVQQVRFTPNNTQGVVTYSAVIEVENRGDRLRPGMTATVSVLAHAAHGVVRIPNSALRFKPSDVAESETPPEGVGRVYVVSRGGGPERIEAKMIRLGITDGVNTEVRGDLAPGTKLVTDELDPAEGEKKGKPF